MEQDFSKAHYVLLYSNVCRGPEAYMLHVQRILNRIAYICYSRKQYLSTYLGSCTVTNFKRPMCSISNIRYGIRYDPNWFQTSAARLEISSDCTSFP